MPEVYRCSDKELAVARFKVHQKEIRDDGHGKGEGNQW